MAGRAGAPGQVRDLTEYVPVADDGLLRYTSPWEGPVVEAWRKTLTPVPNTAMAVRLRRVQRLVGDYHADDVQKIYRDSEDRYVLVIHSNPARRTAARPNSQPAYQ